MSLGVVNVERDILHELTAQQLIGWMAYAGLEPFGDAREDIRNARIVQMLYNTNISERGQAKPLKDFLIMFEEAERVPQTNQQKIEILRAIAVAYSNPEKA